MKDDGSRRKLYETLVNDNYDMPDEQQFYKDMDDEGNRQRLFNTLSEEYDMGTWDEFNSAIGPSAPVASVVEEQPKSDAVEDWKASMVGNNSTKNSSDVTAPKEPVKSVLTPEREKELEGGAMVRAAIKDVVKPNTPSVGENETESAMNADGSVDASQFEDVGNVKEKPEEEHKPVTAEQMQGLAKSLDLGSRFGATARKFSDGNGAEMPKVNLLDNGKPKFGSPEDLANTEKRQQMEREERMQEQFAETPSPMQPEKEQFGSDMPWMQNEEQVSKEENERRSVIRQNIINYPYDHSVWDVTRAMQEEIPIRHYDFMQWADNGVSEKLDKLIAEENKKNFEAYKNETSTNVPALPSSGFSGIFMPSLIAERAFDPQKVLDNVLSVFMDDNGKDITGFVFNRIKIESPDTAESNEQVHQLSEEEMQDAAKFNKHFAYEYGQVAKEIQQLLFDKLKAQNAPKDNLDYVMSSAFNNSLIGAISNAVIQKAAGSSGLRQQMRDMAMAEYGESAGTLTNIAAGIAPLALDVATGGFAIPSLAGSGIRNLATRIMVKNGVRKLSKEAAKEGIRLSSGAAGAVGRMMGTDAAKNVVLNSLASAANFGVYDLQREGVNQWKNGEFDPAGLATSLGEGAVKGALLGTLGTASKVLTRNASLGTKIITDAGAFAGEVGLFTGFDMLARAQESGLGISGIDIDDVVSSAAQNAGVIGGMRLQGWIMNPAKALSEAKARYSNAKDFNINLNDDDWREMQKAGYDKDSFMKTMLGEDLNVVTEANDNVKLENVVGIDYDMGGYKRFMNNTDIPLATRMKVAYIIEGVYPNSSPLNAVYGVVRTKDNGITNISTVDENNNVVTSTDFKDAKDADEHEARMQDVVRFNSVYSLEGALNNFYGKVSREKVGSKSVDELKEIATEGKDYTIDEILQKKDGITDEERQSLDMYTSLLYKNIQDGSEFVRSAQSMKDGSSAGRSADNHEQRRITGRSHEESSVNVDETVENGPDYRRSIDEMIDRGVSEESVARVITESGLTGEQKASLTEYATSKFAVNNVTNQGEQAVSDMETPTPKEEGESAAGDAQKAGDFGIQYQKAVDALMASEGGEFAKRLSDGMLSSADVTDEMIYGWANTAYPKIAKQIIDYVNVYRKYQGMEDGIARKVNDAVEKEKARLEPILDADDDGKYIFRQVEIDGVTRDVVNFNDESQFIFYKDDDGQTKMVAKEKAGEVQTLSYDDYIGEYEKRMQSEIGDPANWAFSHNVNTVREIVPGTDENPGTVIQTPQGRLICVGQDELGNLLFRKAETDTATGKVKGVGEDIPMTKEQAWDLQDDLYDGRIVPTEEIKPTEEVKSTEEAKPTEIPSDAGAVPTETATTETPAIETPTEETGGMKFDDKGEPDFIGSGVDATRGFLYDEKQSGITKEQADGYVDTLIKEAEKALEKANKKTPKSTGFTKMKEELAAIQKEREDAQMALDHWKGVKAMNEKLSVEPGVSVGEPVAASERYGIEDNYIGSEQDLKFKPTNDNGIVVDRSGNELVLYHGTTNTNLKLEDLERGHTRLNGESARFSGDGVSFTPDRTNAEEYADGGNVLECKVSLKNPFIIYGRPFGGGEDGDKAREFTKKLEEDGYDGILVYNSRYLADVVEEPIEVITFNKESIIGLEGNTVAETQAETVQTQENTEQGQTKIPTVKQRKGGKDVYVKQYEEAEPYDTIQDMYATMEGQEGVDEFVREKLRTAKSQMTNANSSGNQERIDRASKKLQYWQGIKSEIDRLIGKENGITEREIADIEDELYQSNLEYRIAKGFGIGSPFRISKKSFMEETGLSERDLERDSKVYITSKGGVTVDELAHKMFEDVHINPPINGNAYESDERMFDSQEIKDALISVLSGSPIRFANELRNDVIKKRRDEEIRQYDDYAVQQGFANAEDMIAHDEVFLVQAIINDKYLDKTDFYNNFGDELGIPHNLEENEQRKSTDLTEGGVSETDSTESPEADRGRVERNDTEGAVEGTAGRNQVLRGTETDKGGGSAGGTDQRAETTAGAEGNEQKGSVPTDSDIRKVERERVAKTAAEQADKEIEAKKAELQAARAELQRKNADIQKEYAKDNDLFGEGRKGEDAQLFETERDYSKDNINSILQKERDNVARIADELKALQEGRQKRIDDAMSAFDAQTTVYQQDGKGNENDSDAVRQNVISNVEAFINENFKGEEKDRLLEELNGYVKEQGNYDMLVGNGEYFHEVRQAFMDRWGGVRAWDDFVRTGKMPKRKRGGFRKEPKEGELLPPSDEKELQARFAEQNTLASNRLEVDKNNEYSKAIALANDALGAVSNLANLIKKAADTYNDWSNRKYKKNDTVVQVGGKYDDMDYTNMSIGAINERRRQNVLRNVRKDAEKYMGYIHTFLNELGIPESEHEKYLPEGFKTFDELTTPSNPLERAVKMEEDRKRGNVNNGAQFSIGNDGKEGGSKPKTAAERLASEVTMIAGENKSLTELDRQVADVVVEMLDGGGVPVKYVSNDEAEAEADTLDYNETNEANAQYHIVSSTIDKKELEQALEEGEEDGWYCAMQIINGELYPVMSAYDDNGDIREPSKYNTYERSDEDPDAIDKNGKYILRKTKGSKKNGLGDTPARYNPYYYLSDKVLNDQFSGASTRPNVVIVECAIPKSEKRKGYHAEKAKDSVGILKWHSGPVNRQLKNKRNVVLSRWRKPLRILSYSEVADMLVKQFGSDKPQIPFNTIHPELAKELEKRGVAINYDWDTRTGEGNPFNKKNSKNDTQLRTSNGVVYGYVKDGVIYLNRDAIKGDTPIHEYTHLWDKALQQTNPELWRKGVDLMKQTPVWEEVMKDENYSGIWGDEDLVASEVHSRLSGKEGAKRLKEMAEEVLNSDTDPLTKAKKLSVIEKLKNWLRKFWWWTKDTFTKWGAKDIEKVSLDDFVNMPLKDLAKGVNPNDRINEVRDRELYDSRNNADLKTGNLGEPKSAEATQITEKARQAHTIHKAPNGKTSNLGRNQWVNVRTVNFKNWFGDFELSALYNQAQRAISEKGYKATYKYAPGEKLKSRLQELLGHEINTITITNDSIRHVGKKHGKNEELRQQINMLPEDALLLPYILDNFDIAKLDPKFNDNDGNRAVTIYKRINGVTIIGTIEKGKDKQAVVTNYKAVSTDALRENQKNSSTPGLNVLNDSELSELDALDAEHVAKVQKDIETIKEKAKNVSKVVDENGEPLVVYHGTSESFNTFDISKGRGSMDIQGAFFSPSSLDAKGYGQNVKAFYLDIKNPANGSVAYQAFKKYSGEYGAGVKAREELIKMGYDGVNNDNEEFIAFYPEQIKSADDMTFDDNGKRIPFGERYDTSNKDVRFSRDYTTHDGPGVVSEDELNGLSERLDNESENPAVATGRTPREVSDAEIDNGFTGSVEKYEDEALKGKHGMNALRIAAENRRYESERPQFHIGLADPDDVPDESGIRTLNVVSGHAADNYNRILKSAAYKWTETWQDSMKSLQVLQDEIVKATGTGIKPDENTYWAENRMSSVNRAQMEVFGKRIFTPLLKAVNAIKKTGTDYSDITDYMMAKHGLERNDVLAMRDARRTADEKVGVLIAAAKNKYRSGVRTERAGKSAKISKLEEKYNKGLIDDATLISETQRIDNEYKTNVRKLKDDMNTEIADAESKRGGIETNEYTKNREKDYAGLTALTGTDNVVDAEDLAQQMVDKFEKSTDTRLINDLWDRVRTVTDAQLDNALDRGLMTEQLHSELKNQYQNYIPLRGFEETTTDEVWEYLDTERSPYSTPIRTAKGRNSKADDPIATLGNVSESGIMEGNRNIMKQHLLRFAENHPSDLVTINKYWAKYDEATDSWETLMPDISVGSTDSEIEQKWAEFEEKMNKLKEDFPELYDKRAGVSKFPYRMLKPFLKEHNVTVQRGGQTYVLTINGNPRAAQAINGRTNPEVVGDITQFMGWVNRFISSMATQKNPAFVLCNLSRDFIYANDMVWMKEKPDYAFRFTNNCGVAVTRLPGLIRKYNKGKLNSSKKYEKMFSDFITNGGETGFTVLHSTKEYKSIVDELIKEQNRGKLNPITVYKYLDNGIDQFNRWAEDVARFAAYMTSIEKGRSEEQAVWDAKQVSVNFNKKGAGSSVAGKYEKGNRLHYLVSQASQGARNAYVFFNPGVQGLDNFATTGKQHKGKMSVVISKWLAMGLAAPMLAGLLARSCGDDEEDGGYWNLPDYVRRQNFCIYTPKGYIKVPLPIELRAIYGMGDITYGMMSGKLNYTSLEASGEVAKQASQILPIDVAGEGSGALWPSSIKPIAEATITNTDWTGMPIEREDYGSSQPNYKRAFNSTSRTLVDACRTLNEWAGGNSGRKGWADFVLDPAKIEHIFEGYLGGVGTIIKQTTRATEQAFGNEEFEFRNTPVGSRFFAETDDRMPQMRIKSEWFKNKKKIDAFHTEMRVNGEDMQDEKLSEKEREKAKGIHEKCLDSDMMWREEIWKEYQKDYNYLKKEFEATGDEEVEYQMYEVMKLMNEVMKVKSVDELN